MRSSSRPTDLAMLSSTIVRGASCLALVLYSIKTKTLYRSSNLSTITY